MEVKLEPVWIIVSKDRKKSRFLIQNRFLHISTLPMLSQ
jgi:hypothetical protein